MMTRLSVLLLATVVAISPIGLAESGDGGGGSEEPDCRDHDGLIIAWAYSEEPDPCNPDPRECRAYYFSAGTLQPTSTIPLLGVIYVDPDGCVQEYVDSVVNSVLTPDDPDG